MAKVAKKIILNVPGIGRVESLLGGTFSPGGHNRESVVTDTDAVHYTEEVAPSKLSFKVPNRPGYLSALRDLSDINVNVQDDHGQSWIITDAFTTQPSELSGGEISVEMNGNTAETV